MIFRFMKLEPSLLMFMLELNLVKDVKCHEGFSRYISSKRKTREIRILMITGTGAQVIESME